MKISIVFTDGYKQVMLTPENDHERSALRMIAPDSVLKGVIKIGTFDRERTHMKEQVEVCQGGYLRRFAQEESLMFVIEEHKPSESL